MRKMLVLFLAFAMLLCLAACGEEKDQQEKVVSTIGEAGESPVIINDFRQSMKPYRQGDGTIHFGNPGGGNSAITIEDGN